MFGLNKRRELACWVVGIVLAWGTVTIALHTSAPQPAIASDNSGEYSGGFVMPGSLAGVNPVQHPDIFGDPLVSASYGFSDTRLGWATQRTAAAMAFAAAKPRRPVVVAKTVKPHPVVAVQRKPLVIDPRVASN